MRGRGAPRARPRSGPHDWLLLGARREPAPRWRIACWLIVDAVLLSVSITPIETISLHFMLSVHLIQNVVLAEWAPLLAVLAIPPALAARAPRVRRSLRSRSGWSTTASGTCLGSTTRRPTISTRCSISSTSSTSPPAPFLVADPSWRTVLRRARRPTSSRAFVLGEPDGLMMALIPSRSRLLRRRAAAVGAVTILDQQIAGVSMAADGIGRLLRVLRLLGRAIQRRAGRHDLMTNVTGMNALRSGWLALPHRLGARLGPGTRSARRQRPALGDDRRTSSGDPRAASDERREPRRPRQRPPQQAEGIPSPLGGGC